MPSRRPAFLWLLTKEWRELLVSKAWWVMLVVMGPLVGMSFISAVRTYAEVSGLNGTSAGVGEALSPLTGVWAPTFSACELAAVFLLPFVTIRLIAGGRQSGALKLELQQGMSVFSQVTAKAMVLLAGWMVAMLPPWSAILLWASYGGSMHAPELLTLTFGHLLNAGITIGLAGVMASITEHPSTAAILTLSATVGTWILNFFGAIQGGWWERAAGYSPAAMVAEFQHGLLRADTTLIALVLTLAGLIVASVWSQLGLSPRRRACQALAAGLFAAGAIVACAFIHPSWDLSENRGNSFSRADEQALRSIRAPLSIEVRLAAQDPRRTDLEQHALAKLRRVLPDLKVRYVAGTSIGVFEQTRPGYGEIWFDLGGRKTMTRTTTAEGVLEAIYSLSGTPPPVENDEAIFRGHPLATPPKGAATVFYVIWPGLFLAIGTMMQRRFS